MEPQLPKGGYRFFPYLEPKKDAEIEEENTVSENTLQLLYIASP